MALREFFNFVGGTLYPDFGFTPEDINVLIETPEQVFAEYTAHTKAARTGRILHHLFAGRLVAKKGKIDDGTIPTRLVPSVGLDRPRPQPASH